ncbi:MAG: FAD/NAD(P)-binding oxidoreductase [Rhodanobacter sp.]
MTERYDVLVVGAGPAGLAAAHAAASHGARVGLLDAQARGGGQVWRHDVVSGDPALARRSVAAALRHPSVEWLPQARVVLAESGGLLVEEPQRARRLEYTALILATGARELLLPFPGWTLPGVTGAGGLQALAKQGWPLAGRRVVIAGSGPLLFAAAATAHRHGAKVLGIYEQAELSSVLRFAAGLWRWPAKVVQAISLRGQLFGVPYRCGSLVRRALGDERVEAVEVGDKLGSRRLECDMAAVGFGLVPDVRLAHMVGCATELEGLHPRVCVDELQRTSADQVYAAGEICGIGGRDCARVEGAIAGHAAVHATAAAAALQMRKRHARAFAAHLRAHFVLGPRVRALPEPDTLICRCEDVSWRALDGYADSRGAKLATRCGMGACQGRICGSALAELERFPHAGERPPLFPARLTTLSGDGSPFSSN